MRAQMKPAKNDSLDAEVKKLDDWIVINDREMTRLQKRLKNISVRDKNLETLASHLMHETDSKTAEVLNIQITLCKANNSLLPIIKRFNDSMAVINIERGQMVIMKMEINTGYFVAATLKELEDNGIVNKEGGFAGSRQVIEIDQAPDNSKFEKKDLTNLKGIALKGKFKGLITIHPDNTYEVISNGNTDSIAITDPFAFWCESKYLVVAVK